MVDDTITVELSRDHSLVLFDWLARTSSSGAPAAFEDQAEQRALWDLEATLESVLTEVLRADYGETVDTARSRLRDAAE